MTPWICMLRSAGLQWQCCLAADQRVGRPTCDSMGVHHLQPTPGQLDLEHGLAQLHDRSSLVPRQCQPLSARLQAGCQLLRCRCGRVLLPLGRA